MEVIKSGICENKKYRILKKFQAAKYDEYDYPVYIEWEEYHVQMKKCGFWITIKMFEVISDEELDSSRPIGLIEAEELFDAIVNPYKVI